MKSSFKFSEPDPEGVELLTRSLGCHPVIAALLYDRGIKTFQEASFFLNPTFKFLKNPFDLADMDKAVERIYTAVVNREKILIFGDFDADGVTATALLTDFFSHAEADVTWYVPHRIKEGYSIHPPHIQIALEMDVDLIITVDCGVGSRKACEAAALEDIDVIVTDHHEPEKALPPALAVINPKRHDCKAGLGYLAGVGVAFYLVMGLRRYFREQGFWEKIDEPALLPYLDLFTIGTIGDMVPLVQDNRVLCRAGLLQMKKGGRPGIQALAQVSRVDLGQLDSDDVSFKMVPRINAAGRISHARICVSHLISPSRSHAQTSAALLDEQNRKRQQIEKEIVMDIENRIFREPSLVADRLLVLADSGWNPSVLGIAASRLSKKHLCPVVLLSLAGDLATGSCRSINTVNIHQALAVNAHLLEKFGGHAMAAGLTLKPENIEPLIRGLKAHFNSRYKEEDYISSLVVDQEIDFNDITIDLAKAVENLSPFGMGNPEPLFLTRNLKVVSSHIIGGCHRKMILTGQNSEQGQSVEAFHFNLDSTRDLPTFYNELLFRLKQNKFKPGFPQMVIQGI